MKNYCDTCGFPLIAEGSSLASCICQNIKTTESAPMIVGYSLNNPTTLNADVEVVTGGKFPTKGKPTDRCYDLYCRKIEFLSHWKIKVYLGVKIKPEDNYAVNVYPRSSASNHTWILSNCTGIGENNFSGEWTAVFDYIPQPIDILTMIETNGIKNAPPPYNVGDRPIQFELVPQPNLILNHVPKLITNGETKTKGYGSSGK